MSVLTCANSVRGVIKVNKGGKNGKFEAVAQVSNIDAAGVERAGVHAITIRLK